MPKSRIFRPPERVRLRLPMPAAAMLRLLSAGSYQVPALRPEEEEPDGGLHRINLTITAFRFASLHLLIFVTNSFLYLSGCSGIYQERVRKEARSFPEPRQDFFLRPKFRVKHEVLSSLHTLIVQGTLDSRKQLFEELLWEHRDLSEAFSALERTLGKCQAPIEDLTGQIAALKAEKEKVALEHQSALAAQWSNAAELKDQLVQTKLQHERALKEAKAAGDGKVEEARKEFAEATAQLREELEEETGLLQHLSRLKRAIMKFDTAWHDASGNVVMESVCENTTTADFKQSNFANFLPNVRSGGWSDIGSRQYMEDTHVCIADLSKSFGYPTVDKEVVSFYGVFDGHGGKDAAHFVRDNLPRVIVEDADFPLELEKVVSRSFVQIDSQFADKCSHHRALSSGTTALTAMIFGRSLLVANAGDCRAVLSRCGIAMEMSTDHRPCSLSEKLRVESLGAYVDDGYLNGLLGVTRALGDWHLEGMKEADRPGAGPLSAEPEVKMTTLTKDDEFLIIGSDGIWDVYSNQNAVDFARRRLQEHNDVKLCCKEIVEEAIRRGATDNLTAVLVSFHLVAPPQIRVNRPGRVARSISADGLNSLRVLLGSQ